MNRWKFILLFSPIYILIFFILATQFLGIKTYPHQLALCLSGLTIFLLRRDHGSWKRLLPVLWKNLKSVLPAIEILFLVGMLIAAWSFSGVLGTMVKFGFLILDVHLFLPGICCIAALASLVSGSSWTTAGTFGLALMGVGEILGFPPEVTCGAIVSGCYFGDKLSPLSDTTNLASNLTSVPIFEHIRHMLKTSLISFSMAVLLYFALNKFIFFPKESSIQTPLVIYLKNSNQNLLLLLPVLFVFGSSFFKLHVRISLLLGIVSSGILGISDLDQFVSFSKSMVLGFVSETGEPAIDTFLSGGGISAILPTEFLILSAVWFGANLENSGYLKEILEGIGEIVKKQKDVIFATMSSALLLNLTTADQYLSIVIPANAFRNLAESNHIPNKDISRALEDSGTITSALIPWNSCGAFMAASLGVATIHYLPYVFFNLIHICLSVALLGFKKSE